MRSNRNKEGSCEDRGRGQVMLVRKALQLMDSEGREIEELPEVVDG